LTVHRSRTPRHAIARATALGGIALVAGVLLAWAPAPTTGWNQGSAESTLFQLMNGARVNNGRRAVQQNGTLVSLARWRSKDQVDRDYFSHTVLGTGYEVYHWYDLNGLDYAWGGENIGWNNGYSDADSPVAIHQGFMASPGHRANILEPSFTHGGVGAYAKDNVSFLGKQRSPRFYTQLFMQAASGPLPPPPPGGGGGGGGGGPQPPPSGGGGGVSASPTRGERDAKPRARPLHVDAPAAPRASSPMDGGSVVAAVRGSASSAAVRAMAFAGDGAAAVGSVVARPADSLRVESAAAPERGLFETVLGSLLGFVL
jgi:uncharacterized protein YkwD